MEALPVPTWKLQDILALDSRDVPRFSSIVPYSVGADNRGKIALALNKTGSLTYPPLNRGLSYFINETKSVPPAERFNKIYQLNAELPPFPFAELPSEIQLEILGRVSPTAREAAIVSKGMKELADIVLMDNIRRNDLIDPTIGIPERAKYFKLDKYGEGEYFEPEPGMWRQMKVLRKHRIPILGPMSYILYGELDITGAIQSKPEVKLPNKIKIVVPVRIRDYYFDKTRNHIRVHFEHGKSIGLPYTGTFGINISVTIKENLEAYDRVNYNIIHNLFTNALVSGKQFDISLLRVNILTPGNISIQNVEHASLPLSPVPMIPGIVRIIPLGEDLDKMILPSVQNDVYTM